MSKIEWTHRPGTKSEVWNPTTGCDKISRGCKNCYAQIMHRRLRAMGQKKYQHDFLGDVHTHEDELLKPLSWKKPRTVFVDSMSDLFHEDVPFHFIDKVFAVMAECPQHVFIILTKRNERMVEYYNSKTRTWSIWQEVMVLNPNSKWDDQLPLKNVWQGVSAEHQTQYDLRVLSLMAIKAALKVISIEPQVGPINMFSRFDSNEFNNFWVLNGGESGHKAEPSHPDWFRKLRDQCKYAGIPYFFKQWGAWEVIDIFRIDQKMNKVGYFNDEEKFVNVHSAKYLPTNFGHLPSDRRIPMTMEGKRSTGNFLDGRQHLEFPKI